MSSLESSYRDVYARALVPLAETMDRYLRELFTSFTRLDRITTRAKSVSRFLEKAEQEEDGRRKYTDPLNEIQDQIGARIVTFYLSDVEQVAKMIQQYFRAVEQQRVVPDSESEFGYVGRHFILFIPTDFFDEKITEEMAPTFFELQIKTLFQHAWSEANHDLGYKSDAPLTFDQKRCIAYTAAQAWGADRMFNDLYRETSSN